MTPSLTGPSYFQGRGDDGVLHVLPATGEGRPEGGARGQGSGSDRLAHHQVRRQYRAAAALRDGPLAHLQGNKFNIVS